MESLPPPYPRDEIPFLNQVAVDLPFRGRGIGDLLLERCEARARELGRPALGLDTAEGAKHLVAWYGRRGYREVGHHHWPGKTYRSVVMLKEFTVIR
jgi:GNAT superfamily N-acetyltransferase